MKSAGKPDNPDEKINDFWDELTSEQQKEIKEAILELEQGKIIDYEVFMVKHR